MASREDRKREAREARLAHEEQEAAKARQARRLRMLGAVVAAAVVLVVVAVLVSSGGDDETSPPVTADRSAQVVREVARSLDGIPQDGLVLGRKDAPVTMVEFADPQCPFCGEFATQALPAIVEQEVRAGRLKVELRLLTFLDDNLGTDDSQKIARLALAAAQQDRLWHVAEAAYRLQGQEGSRYATDAFLRGLVTGVPGLDGPRALAATGSDPVTRELGAAVTAQNRYGVRSTPTFLIGRTGQELEPFEPSSLTAQPFVERVRELAGA
ncbi:thioredoxin domain-containing protein [Conexibacter sp. SYSU D00693]|uniref:DsbA family protein n=1 Tax=Conexibacter sp. SYSU D00693 TaxID=2812560 RepID=UPI00196B0FDC|nr:thioredoxin domain-containing protein [Conexibacter sp. SYSU D00693]